MELRRRSRPTLATYAAEEIVKLIREQSLLPGDRLPTEQELCERLDISRTGVREALKALKERGIIQAIPSRGTFVAAPDARNVARMISSLLMAQRCTRDDVYQVRRCLEVSLAEKAASNATVDQLAKIDLAFNYLAHVGDDTDAAMQAEKDFHVGIAEASGNMLAATLVEALMEITLEMRRETFLRGSRNTELHDGVLKAIHQRSPLEAGVEMTKHFDTTDVILAELSLETNSDQ